MASKPFFTLLGRRAAAGVVAGGAVGASQPAAHAREAVAPAPARTAPGQPQLHDADDWLETHFDQEVLVFRSFRPDEVDQAVDSLQSALLGQDVHSGAATAKGAGAARLVAVRKPALTIEEEDGDHPLGAGSSSARPQSDATDTTFGDDATEVLGEPLLMSPDEGLGGAAAVVASQQQQQQQAQQVQREGQASDLLEITRRLLRRPGLQREVIKCMMEDAEVRDLMLRQSRNIDLYLQAAGVHHPAGLLTGGPAEEGRAGGPPSSRRLPRSVRLPADGNFVHEDEEDQEEEGGRPPNPLLGKILDAVAAAIDQTGSLLAGLGGWLRGRFLELGALLGGAFGMAAPSAADPDEGFEGAREGGRGGDAVLGAVMVVTVAVFCVLLARAPGLVVGSAMATAGAAAAAKKQQVMAGATSA